MRDQISEVATPPGGGATRRSAMRVDICIPLRALLVCQAALFRPGPNDVVVSHRQSYRQKRRSSPTPSNASVLGLWGSSSSRGGRATLTHGRCDHRVCNFGAVGWLLEERADRPRAKASAFVSALSGSPGRVGTNTLAGAKAGGSPRAHGGALQHPGSGVAVDANALASGDEAVASGVPAGAAAGRPEGERRSVQTRHSIARKALVADASTGQRARAQRRRAAKLGYGTRRPSVVARGWARCSGRTTACWELGHSESRGRSTSTARYGAQITGEWLDSEIATSART
jgi:hypothetical protein